MNHKRKLEEFHDPDYPQNDNPAAAKRMRTSSLSAAEKCDRMRALIKKEFQNEIANKEEQLDEVDSRIAKAKQLLHQVRYAVVSDYYAKTSLQYNDTDAAQILESCTDAFSSVETEPKGPQMPIHPALKSILGKSSADYDDILRIRPTREAAKTAKTSIKEKLRTKKEEMRLQRQIRQGGIVIDHSKQETTTTTSNEEAAPLKIPRHIEPNRIEKNIPKLNAARGSNQTRHMIVVGNTSKYIGDEKASDGTTHKWLIYVQTKTTIPIEKFVTKVRFFLHESYRPNDVVDVDTPPFQIARRGWGEFPVRVQLFFDPKLQQKPLQLVHNLVLDKTLSGLQTMGAETLVEMWLRSESMPSTSTSSESNTSQEPIITSIKQEIPEPASHLNGEIDENFLDFLDKIETPIECQDIDNIQPTFIDSPMVDFAFSRVPLGRPPVNNITQSILNMEQAMANGNVNTTSTNVEPNELPTVQKVDNFTQPTKVIQSNITPIVQQQNSSINQPEKVAKTTMPEVKIQSPTPANQNQPKFVQRKLMQYMDKDGKLKVIQMLVAGPKPTPPGKLNGQMPTIPPGQPKIVRLVGKPGTLLNGNKIVPVSHMRTVSPANAGKGSVYVLNGNKYQAVAQRPIPNQMIRPPAPTMVMKPPPAKAMPSSSVMSSPRSIASAAPPKNQVFQKDGKMYIIDRAQSMLKQQQRKQESLLKPQISLLKPRLPNGQSATTPTRPTPVVADHDYLPKASRFQKAYLSRPISVTSKLTLTHPQPPKSAIIPAKLIMSTNKSVSLMRKPRRDYVKELEEKFYATTFHQTRTAVEFILRKLPLINEMAKDLVYRSAFPFVVNNLEAFKQLTPLKLKSFEWLRAKYISKCIRNHSAFKQQSNSNKPTAAALLQAWSTKEIIIFARHHAYTPQTVSPVIEESGPKVASDNFNLKRLTNDNVITNPIHNGKSMLTDLIKSEMKNERYSYQSISLCHDIYDWIHLNDKKIANFYETNDEIIDVDAIDDAGQQAIRTKKFESPMKLTSNKFWIPMDEKYEHEASLVSQTTQDIGIRLQSEDFGNDVLYPAAQTVIAHSLRIFIDDLIRRSIAGKKMDESESSPVNATLQPEDIFKVINTRPEFDFLTNKNLGVIKSKEIGEPE